MEECAESEELPRASTRIAKTVTQQHLLLVPVEFVFVVVDAVVAAAGSQYHFSGRQFQAC